MSDNSSSSSRAVSRVGSPVGALPEFNAQRPYRFIWDPATRKPGPGSVSETTEGRGDFYGVLPPVELANASMANLSLDALPHEWSSSKYGFHAISTVLNNPHRRQAPPKAHSSLPTVPHADLPRVKRKDFDSYLRAIAPEWERFERRHELGREGGNQMEGPSTPRTPVDHPSSRNSKSLPPLESVPAVFFEPGFKLADPVTFDAVTEQGVGGTNSDPSSLSHSLPLLEKFSHYADTVEQHLVQEISLRSTSFFAALTNLHELQNESEQCLDRIAKLRDLLKDVDEKGAKRGLELVRKEAKLRNLENIGEGIKAVSGVVEMAGVAQGLVGAGQWGEALGVIEELERLWVAEPAPVPLSSPSRTNVLPTPTRKPTLQTSLDTSHAQKPYLRKSSSLPLSSLHAFAGLPSQLRTLTMEIASSLSLELVNVLRTDLLERMDGDFNAPPISHDHVVNQSLKDRLRPLLQSLVRTKGIREATLSWREVVLDLVRGATKRHLPSFDLDERESKVSPADASSGNGSLTNHLHTMSHAEFMALIRAIYKTFLNGVRGLQVQGGIILNILESIDPPDPSLDIPSLQEELVDILSSAAELSNARAASVISRRSEQHAALELADFVVFFNDSWNFVVKCEVICRRMVVGLRGVVVSQSKAFLQTFHQSRISQSAKLVEEEQWNPSEVLPSLQHVADILVDCAVHDSSELVLAADLSSPLTPPPKTNGHASPSLPLPTSPTPSQTPTKANGSTASSKASKQIRIEERAYFAVSATAEVLVLLLDYLRVIFNLSMLTTDTMGRVIEFLKAFNSRTCQVVLGAGAMRSAGLKNITAKHLALASQSLSIMIALVPYVRETFRRHLSSKHAVMLVEFDKLKRDFQEHQNEIHAKLIAIMGDRLSVHIHTLQSVNWDSPGPGINGYMELLVKETVTLHKVLSRYLTAPVVQYVMMQVFAAINHRLSEEYTKIDLPHQEAKTKLLADAKYLREHLTALKGVDPPSGMLETVIAEKRVARSGKAQTQSPGPSGGAVGGPGSSANQRIRGMLLGNKSAGVEKDLPTPMPASDSPQQNVRPGLSERRRSSIMRVEEAASVNGDFPNSVGSPGVASNRLQSPLPATPREDGASAGLEQVSLVDSSPSADGQSPPPMPPLANTSLSAREESDRRAGGDVVGGQKGAVLGTTFASDVGGSPSPGLDLDKGDRDGGTTRGVSSLNLSSRPVDAP